MFPNSIAAFGKSDAVSRDQYAADFQAQTHNLNVMFQMLRGKAYKSAGQSIPSATITDLTFNTKDYDVGVDGHPVHSTILDPARFIALATGFFLAQGQVAFPADAGGTYRYIRARVNGLDLAAIPETLQAPNGAVPAQVLQVSAMVQLTYADYVTFAVGQDSGGALATLPTFTYGSLVLLSRL